MDNELPVVKKKQKKKTPDLAAAGCCGCERTGSDQEKEKLNILDKNNLNVSALSSELLGTYVMQRRWRYVTHEAKNASKNTGGEISALLALPTAVTNDASLAAASFRSSASSPQCAGPQDWPRSSSQYSPAQLRTTSIFSDLIAAPLITGQVAGLAELRVIVLIAAFLVYS